jgi:hypothetical protein
MSSQIVINSSHFRKNENDFRYQFPIQQKFSKGDSIAISSINIFNSFFNVNALIGNTIKIEFPTGASGYVSKTIVLDDGFYDCETFNYKLQQICVDNGFYSTTTTGSLFYLSIGVSTTQYTNYVNTSAVQLTATPPTGAAWVKLTGSPRSPRLYLGKISPLFGFPSDPSLTVFRGMTSLASFYEYSTITPQINPYNSLIVRCNCVQNTGLASSSDFLYSFSINAGFTSLITSPNTDLLYNDLITGNFSELILSIYDNNLNKVVILDTNVLIVVSIIKNN